MTKLRPRLGQSYYLRQDGDSEGLVAVFTHQVEGDDRKDVPWCVASLPTYQLLPQPEPRRKLFSLKAESEQTVFSPKILLMFYWTFGFVCVVV